MSVKLRTHTSKDGPVQEWVPMHAFEKAWLRYNEVEDTPPRLASRDWRWGGGDGEEPTRRATEARPVRESNVRSARSCTRGGFGASHRSQHSGIGRGRVQWTVYQPIIMTPEPGPDPHPTRTRAGPSADRARYSCTSGVAAVRFFLPSLESLPNVSTESRAVLMCTAQG